MGTKEIDFYIQTLIIGDTPFDSSIFEVLNVDIDNCQVFNNEVVSATLISKELVEDRFIFFEFKIYEKYPYSEKVAEAQEETTTIVEKDNTRDINDMELKHQVFLAIDPKTQRIYTSNRKKMSLLTTLISDNVDKNVYLKQIIDESNFLETLEKVNEISLTVEKDNLLSCAQGLSDTMRQDIHGYGADEATLAMKYKEGISIDSIRDKIQAIVGNKLSYKRLTIVGKNTQRLESVFNMQGIASRLVVEVSSDEGKKELEASMVRDQLINKIKENE